MLNQAADKYKIKYSTAKTILRVYKNEGRIFKKKKRAPRKHKIPSAQANDIIDIENLPRTLPIPGKLKSMISKDTALWANIFTSKFS
jgi:hypothetical protein